MEGKRDRKEMEKDSDISYVEFEIYDKYYIIWKNIKICYINFESETSEISFISLKNKKITIKCPEMTISIFTILYNIFRRNPVKIKNLSINGDYIEKTDIEYEKLYDFCKYIILNNDVIEKN